MTGLTLPAVHACDADQFVARFADICEDTPWVAERASRRRPFGSLDAMAAAFAAVLVEAKTEEQLAVLRAHPDLAGKLARAGSVAEHSRSEQRGAGLDRLTDAEFEQFETLNRQYRDRFGFPFIFAVKGAGKAEILQAFERRLPNTADEELAQAVEQVCRIMRFRLAGQVFET